MFAGEFIQALDLAVNVVREDQGRAFGQPNFKMVFLRSGIWQSEQQQRCSALGLPNTFDGSNLGRLMFERIQSMQVADKNLQRDQQRSQDDAGTQCVADVRPAIIA